MAIASNPTQEFVPIKEIRDGTIILKDGGMRAVFLASSLNFSLKSEDEKNAIILQFQDFLNSLDFSIEITVQSRKLDIRPYIALLEEKEKNQLNSLLKIQTREYIEFIRNFTENTDIMTKNFFIIIPYSPAPLQGKSSLSAISSIFSKKQNKSSKQTDFEENRTQLEERMSVVEQGLARSGIRVVRLGTEEIVELMYKAFNPGETEKPIQAK